MTESNRDSERFQTKSSAVDIAEQLSQRLVLIIPALNEQESIATVLSHLPAVACVIVVDNGSTDQTAELAAQEGASVVTEPQRGYGSACLAGLRELDTLDPQSKWDLVGFLDADFADDSDFLLPMAEPIFKGTADFVLSSRMSGKREKHAMPPQAIWGNWLACTLMKWLFRAKYTDLGPMRILKRSSLEELHMTDTNFGWTVEMQIKAMAHRLRIEEVPVTYRQRIGTSKISGTLTGSVKAGIKILWLIFKYGLPAWWHMKVMRSPHHSTESMKASYK